MTNYDDTIARVAQKLANELEEWAKISVHCREIRALLRKANKLGLTYEPAVNAVIKKYNL